MASHSPALISLCACLRGELPERVDWLSLLGLANQTLTTPSLIGVIDQFEQRIPEDVCAYVRDIYQRNVVRNERLKAQLEEATITLNQQGVKPVLLKGAAGLAVASNTLRPTRLMNDLDLLIGEEQVEVALAALAGIGYEMDFQAAAGSERWYADLKRPHDVGAIDIHQSDPPGPAYFYRTSGNILEHSRLTSIGRGTAYIPTATLQALVLIIHDQFQDYDYWIGGIDVRHLLDLRDLSNSPEGIDWDQLAALSPSKLARNAVESQLIALAELFRVDVPLRMRRRLIPRLQFRRRLLQARYPVARWPLLAATFLDYGNYRRGPGAEYLASGKSGRTSWSIPRSGTLRFILGITGDQRVGKV